MGISLPFSAQYLLILTDLGLPFALVCRCSLADIRRFARLSYKAEMGERDHSYFDETEFISMT